jgi:hypothetical protein
MHDHFFAQVVVQDSVVSHLSRMLSKGSNDSDGNDSTANVQLTLYLPDRSSVDVRVSACTLGIADFIAEGNIGARQ